MNTEPQIEQRAAQPYVAIRSRVTMSELPTLVPLWDEVMGWLASKGVEPSGAPFWNYRIVNMENQLEIDVAWPVAAPLPGEGRIVAGELPAGRYATTIHTGPYDDDGLMLATRDLLAWAEKERLEWDKWPSGPTGEGWKARAEIYITDPQEQPDPAKYETQLAFKLADA